MKTPAIHACELALQKSFRDALAALRPPRKSRNLTAAKNRRR